MTWMCDEVAPKVPSMTIRRHIGIKWVKILNYRQLPASLGNLTGFGKTSPSCQKPLDLE